MYTMLDLLVLEKFFAGVCNLKKLIQFSVAKQYFFLKIEKRVFKVLSFNFDNEYAISWNVYNFNIIFNSFYNW